MRSHDAQLRIETGPSLPGSLGHVPSKSPTKGYRDDAETLHILETIPPNRGSRPAATTLLYVCYERAA